MRSWVVLWLVGCYAPSIPTGAPCGAGSACPSGLACASATNTCEYPGQSNDDAAPADTMTADTPVMLDAPPNVPMATLVGGAKSAEMGSSVSLAVSSTIPAGTMLVAELAARGDPPAKLSDSRNGAWVTVVEVGNNSGASIAGIYATVLANALLPGDTIVAEVASSNAYTRALVVLQLDSVRTTDQIGTSQTPGTSQSVTTIGSVVTGPQLELATIATGFNTADAYAPGSGFDEIDEFGTAFSSGSFNRKIVTSASGPQTFSVTTLHAAASYALVIATFR